MKFKIYYIGILLAFVSLSCERYDPVNVGEIDCYECYSPRPEWVALNVKVTINDENKRVPLTIYIGNIENGNVDWIDTTAKEDYWVDVYPNQYYSVSAEYKDGSRTIFAIDGDKIDLKYTDDSCDKPCYYSVGGYVDVQLKSK